MKMMRLNERCRVTRNAIALLEKAGSEIAGFNLTPPRPVIDINFPSCRLAETAIEVSEQVNGMRRTVFLSRFNGCVVRWTN